MNGPWYIWQQDCGHQSSPSLYRPAVGQYLTCRQGTCQGQKRIVKVDQAPE